MKENMHKSAESLVDYYRERPSFLAASPCLWARLDV